MPRLSKLALTMTLLSGIIGCSQRTDHPGTHPQEAVVHETGGKLSEQGQPDSNALENANSGTPDDATAETSTTKDNRSSEPTARATEDFPEPAQVPENAEQIYAHATNSEGWFIYSALQGGQASLLTFYSPDRGANWKSSAWKLDPDINQKMTEHHIFVAIAKTGGKNQIWLLLTSDPGAGLMTKKLYLSDNELQSFSLVSDVSDKVEGYVSGVTFADAQHGWTAASYHGSVTVPLYRTTDGGKSWVLQNIDIPEGFKYGNVSPPQFDAADSKTGSLTIEFVSDTETRTYIYKTKDAGEHWAK
ncbi:WD40/YVTN/BNR-like repeat-containing protein [Paenibacillus sp. S28]|uniref:WD40/YVTN/BNR-like repeat-containing protein n=1 Tax=Paenibacillus sp. S28 TaxID=2767463 RepID=UPI00190A6477|nr:hypothetical protein [Paenibacillus sp. S28]MBJ9990085.1 hypothetical protein [Paenibacillus sp. S28]